jgi:hypothetical protein
MQADIHLIERVAAQRVSACVAIRMSYIGRNADGGGAEVVVQRGARFGPQAPRLFRVARDIGAIG